MNNTIVHRRIRTYSEAARRLMQSRRAAIHHAEMFFQDDNETTLFQSPWWLDAVTDGDWRAVSASDGDGAALWLPYRRERRLGFTRLVMPPLTHTLGPVLRGVAPGGEGLAARRRLLGEALARLPPHAGFFQVLDPAVGDAADFAAHGFDIGVRYTFRIGTRQGTDAVWRDFKPKARAKVRAAERATTLDHGLDLLAFHTFYDANLEARGLANHHDRRLYERLAEAFASRDRHHIIAARDRITGALVAAVLLVWDAQALYYLRTTRDPGHPTNGTPSLLVWEAIKRAATLGLPFDSDTYAGEGGARFLLSFGAVPTPRLTVTRNSPALRAALALGRWWGRA